MSGRPRVLTPAIIAEISRRRERGETHDQIGRALGIPAGTSRYGAWVSRRPESLRPPRLQSVLGPGPSVDASPAVSAARPTHGP